ncbi:uncharacterized protein L3040_002029 [Drepanopeziza brunnea f. sp. 'multigermtubi']|uniref:uncharacterized protein n=1 Tax=Drepanopeziza brunnea f. sp. 'multigermtubi' TaxID=698441 RepID=UPI00238F4167|nr:hypothetical protein L3040_002029 [Drepanopeziza brunnea f. sp. 'multigermtubi']
MIPNTSGTWIAYTRIVQPNPRSSWAITIKHRLGRPLRRFLAKPTRLKPRTDHPRRRQDLSGRRSRTRK